MCVILKITVFREEESEKNGTKNIHYRYDLFQLRIQN